MGKLSWHVDQPPPFAFDTPDQQVQPFGKSLGAKVGHSRPFNLRVDDIPGASPRSHCFTTAPRLTDPLEPCYLLPHSKQVQPAPPTQKFIRNAIDNSDIAGAQARPERQVRQHRHNLRLDCSDVEGAAPGWQPDWKKEARARHAAQRPATAPVSRRLDRVTRPTNYLKDIERSSPLHPSNAEAHQAKVHAADTAAARGAAAQQLLQEKVRSADSAVVSSLWRQFRTCDREASGKLSSGEFAIALQNSKLGLSSAEVLHIAHNMADCHGLLDYRPVTHMLRSQGSAVSGPQSTSCAGPATNKPPQARPSSSIAALRSCGGAEPDTNPVWRAAERTDLDSVASRASAAHAPQHASNAGIGQKEAAEQDIQTRQSGRDKQRIVRPETGATLQQTSRVAECDASRAASGNAPSSSRPQTAPVKRLPGPSAQKVPYFFSKGQVNMEQPYKWMPSKDNTTIQEAGSQGSYERPWSSGHSTNWHVKGSKAGQAQVARTVCVVAGSKDASSFYDDSPQFQRPVQLAAAVDVSHRDSPQTRRNKVSLLDDMMTIRRL